MEAIASPPTATKHLTERRTELELKDETSRNGNYELEDVGLRKTEKLVEDVTSRNEKMTGTTLQREENFNKDNYQLNNYQLKASSSTMAFYSRWKNFAGDHYAQDKVDSKVNNGNEAKRKLKKIPEEF